MAETVQDRLSDLAATLSPAYRRGRQIWRAAQADSKEALLQALYGLAMPNVMGMPHPKTLDLSWIYYDNPLQRSLDRREQANYDLARQIAESQAATKAKLDELTTPDELGPVALPGETPEEQNQRRQAEAQRRYIGGQF